MLLERRGREELPSLAGDMVLLNRLVILWQLLHKNDTIYCRFQSVQHTLMLLQTEDSFRQFATSCIYSKL